MKPDLRQVIKKLLKEDIFLSPMVGDKLYCHRSVIMDYSGQREFIQGKVYEVVDIDKGRKQIVLMNESRGEHFFSVNPDEHSYYKKWFEPFEVMDQDELDKILDQL